MLTGGTLAVVLVTDNNPWDAGGLVLTGSVWDTTTLASDVVLSFELEF